MPQLSLPAQAGPPRVALTFDACTGRTDMRILDVLVQHRIKATLFVTARWLKRNPQALAILTTHPDLFELENHGARHLALVDWPTTVFGVAAAGSPAAVTQEVRDGAAAVLAATGRQPTWFRGATAEYSAGALREVEALHYRLGGFSLSGDGGALYSAAHAARVVAAAKPGDVVLAHINQPARPAGQGVADGILALQKAGFVFVRLDEAFPPPAHDAKPQPRIGH